MYLNGRDGPPILFNKSDSTPSDTKYCEGNKRCSVDIGNLNPAQEYAYDLIP